MALITHSMTDASDSSVRPPPLPEDSARGTAPNRAASCEEIRPLECAPRRSIWHWPF
jgi:hypothetical protein